MNRCHGDGRLEWERRREIKGENRQREGERDWISEHIAHYSPRQGCEILSQLELAVEVLIACGAVGGERVYVCVRTCTYCCSDTGVSLKVFGEQNRKKEWCLFCCYSLSQAHDKSDSIAEKLLFSLSTTCVHNEILRKSKNSRWRILTTKTQQVWHCCTKTDII